MTIKEKAWEKAWHLGLIKNEQTLTLEEIEANAKRILEFWGAAD